MYYCGLCSRSLDEEQVNSGSCPKCGVAWLFLSDEDREIDQELENSSRSLWSDSESVHSSDSEKEDLDEEETWNEKESAFYDELVVQESFARAVGYEDAELSVSSGVCLSQDEESDTEHELNDSPTNPNSGLEVLHPIDSENEEDLEEGASSEKEEALLDELLAKEGYVPAKVDESPAGNLPVDDEVMNEVGQDGSQGEEIKSEEDAPVVDDEAGELNSASKNLRDVMCGTPRDAGKGGLAASSSGSVYFTHPPQIRSQKRKEIPESESSPFDGEQRAHLASTSAQTPYTSIDGEQSRKRFRRTAKAEEGDGGAAIPSLADSSRAVTDVERRNLASRVEFLINTIFEKMIHLPATVRDQVKLVSTSLQDVDGSVSAGSAWIITLTELILDAVVGEADSTSRDRIRFLVRKNQNGGGGPREPLQVIGPFLELAKETEINFLYENVRHLKVIFKEDIQDVAAKHRDETAEVATGIAFIGVITNFVLDIVEGAWGRSARAEVARIANRSPEFCGGAKVPNKPILGAGGLMADGRGSGLQ